MPLWLRHLLGLVSWILRPRLIPWVMHGRTLVSLPIRRVLLVLRASRLRSESLREVRGLINFLVIQANILAFHDTILSVTHGYQIITAYLWHVVVVRL